MFHFMMIRTEVMRISKMTKQSPLHLYTRKHLRETYLQIKQIDI